MFKVDKRWLGWVVISALLLVQFVFLASTIIVFLGARTRSEFLLYIVPIFGAFIASIYITMHPHVMPASRYRIPIIRYFMLAIVFYLSMLVSPFLFIGLPIVTIAGLPYVIVGVTLWFIAGFLMSDPVAFEGVNVFGLFAVLLGIAIPIPFNAILYLCLVVAKWWEQYQSIENRQRRWTDRLMLLTIVLGAACFLGPLPSVFDELRPDSITLESVSLLQISEAEYYVRLEAIIVDAAVLLLRLLALLIPVWVISEVRTRKLLEFTPQEWQNLTAFVGVACVVAFIGVALLFPV